MSEPMEVRARLTAPGTWEVSLPWRRGAVKGKGGVRPRRTVHAETEEQALAMGREVFEREYVAYKMGVTMGLADLALFFVDHAEADGSYSATTARDYRNVVKRYVSPHFNKDADQVQAADVERFYGHLLDGGARDGGGVSAGTVHKLNTVLRATYAFLVREGVCDRDPMQSVELPARARPGKRSLTEREFSKLIGGLERELAADVADDAGILRRNCLFGAYLDLHTGARVGEICALERGDVRVIEGAVRIEHSMSERGGLHRKEPKTASGRRTVSLGVEPFEMLRRHYAWQAGYLTDAQRDSDSTPVCCTAQGAHIRPSVMSATFKEFCGDEGLELGPGESFHILRHTHATQLLANKVNPEVVRERLGHSRIETTFGYGHVMPGDDRAAARDFGQIVDRARKGGGLR